MEKSIKLYIDTSVWNFAFETDYRKLDEACRGLLQQTPLGIGANEKQWWRNIVLKLFQVLIKFLILFNYAYYHSHDKTIQKTK